MARIALDAMGGDNAPEEIVAGAVMAANDGIDVVLVGDEVICKDLLGEHGATIPVVHASEVIGMGEDAGKGVREKPDASVVRCARLVRQGEAAGFVSAGSTGAAMAAASVVIGRAKGVQRAALATIFPTPGNATVVLDTGANTEVKPDHLAQFGVMGSVVAEIYVGLDTPRVGLLNIGEEEAKGRDLEKTAFNMLKAAPINFVGNIEGRDLASGKADVIVTDGFTGNVLLKTAEGAALWVIGLAMEALGTLEQTHLQAVLPALRRVRHLTDSESTGGAHLVGLKGVAVIAHGSSSSTAIVNALALARNGIDQDLVGRVAARLAAR